ncbi:MAG: efflux RND transporter periplasmic adaptor subunit [Pirellulales bacterium]|nr:efflux RND transporter periplasmic adaptor subunit [Pirellulales bacterium]
MQAKTILRVLKPILGAIVGMALLLLIIAWMLGWHREKIEPGESEVVAEPRLTTEEIEKYTDQVHEVSKQEIVEAVGTLKASNRTEISARVLAPIEKINVRAGQAVHGGEAIVELDDRALKTQYSQAQAALVAAEVALRKAKNDYLRDRQLFQHKAISQSQMDDTTARVESARADIDAKREAVAEAEVMLSYAKIAAPKSGVIVDRLAEPGDMARPGVPLLVLYDPESLRLEVPVMEKLAIKLKVGEPYTVHIDALDRDFQGTVDEIVPEAQAASRSFLVKVALPKSTDLFEGMFGRLKIPTEARRHLCLATDAIERIGQLEFVDVVHEDGRIERRYIETGRWGMEGRKEVLSGLKAGERVLLRSKMNK